MTLRFSQDLSLDYYAILGVGASATHEEIKAAFRRKVKLVHPDINPSPSAKDQFIVLTEAYRVLGDVRIREIYDQVRFCAVARAPVQAATSRRRRPARARSTRRRPGVVFKAACFSGVLILCCSLVVDFGLDRRLMAGARGLDRVVASEPASQNVPRSAEPEARD